MNREVKVLAFAGSLRAKSYNRGLIRASQELAPAGMTIESFDLSPIPLYNADIEHDLPESVREFKSAITLSDGLLIAAPEYNHSMTGVLKNAIDWGTKPGGENSFVGKPVIVQSASTGLLGGSRGQYQLRQVLGSLQVKELQFPEVFVTLAKTKFDESGELTDERAREQISTQLEKFRDFVRGSS